MLSSDKAAGLAVVLAIVVKVGGFTVALAAQSSPALVVDLVALAWLWWGSTKKGVRPRSRTVPQAVKIAVAAQDGGRCRICGSTVGLYYDHIVPYSRGGRSDDVNNIQLLCAKHNLRKGNRYVG